MAERTFGNVLKDVAGSFFNIDLTVIWAFICYFMAAA